MDLSDSIVPKSDQINAEDLLAGPRLFTVKEVRKGTADQPVDIELVEFPGRPFKPSKTVRRILVAAWGPDAAAYVGRRMVLYRDPSVLWGGQAVGGIRVSHLSHIDKPLTLALTVTRGKRAPYVVQPLPRETTAQRPQQSQQVRPPQQPARPAPAPRDEIDKSSRHPVADPDDFDPTLDPDWGQK